MSLRGERFDRRQQGHRFQFNLRREPAAQRDLVQMA